MSQYKTSFIYPLSEIVTTTKFASSLKPQEQTTKNTEDNINEHRGLDLKSKDLQISSQMTMIISHKLWWIKHRGKTPLYKCTMGGAFDFPKDHDYLAQYRWKFIWHVRRS